MKVRRRGGGMKERGEDGRDPKYRSTQSEKEKLRLLLVMTPVKVRPLGTRFHDRAHAIRLFSALPSFLPLPLTLTPLARSLSSAPYLSSFNRPTVSKCRSIVIHHQPSRCPKHIISQGGVTRYNCSRPGDLCQVPKFVPGPGADVTELS